MQAPTVVARTVPGLRTTYTYEVDMRGTVARVGSEVQLAVAALPPASVVFDAALAANNRPQRAPHPDELEMPAVIDWPDSGGVQVPGAPARTHWRALYAANADAAASRSALRIDVRA